MQRWSQFHACFWSKDEIYQFFSQVSVDSGRFRALQDGSVLQIVGVYRRDEGIYTCVADNGIGRPATLDITLVVNGMYVMELNIHAHPKTTKNFRSWNFDKKYSQNFNISLTTFSMSLLFSSFPQFTSPILQTQRHIKHPSSKRTQNPMSSFLSEVRRPSVVSPWAGHDPQ